MEISPNMEMWRSLVCLPLYNLKINLKLFRILNQEIKTLGNTLWEQTMVCLILTANSAKYCLVSCHAAEPHGMHHCKCTAKRKGAQKMGRKSAGFLALLFLQNHQTLKYKRKKEVILLLWEE